MTDCGVVAGPEQRAREPHRWAPVAHRLHAVDEHPHDTPGSGDQARSVARAGRGPGRRARIRRWGRRRRGRPRSPRQQAAVAEPEELRRLAGHHVHGVDDGDQLASTQAVLEEGGRIVRTAHAVEVGAGVGAADHGPGVVQISARRDQVVSSPSSVLGHSTVRRSSASTMSSRVSNSALPRSAAMSATSRPRAAFVGGGVGVADDVGGPAGQAAEHPGLLAVGPLVERGPHGGVGQLGDALLGGQAHHVAPAGDEEEGAVGAEAHVHGHERGHGQGHDPPARLGGPGRGGQLVPDPIGRPGVDGEDVPVQRALGGDAHGGHEVDLLVAERVEAAVGDVLERGALVGATSSQKASISRRSAWREVMGRRRRRSGSGTARTRSRGPRRPATRPAARRMAAISSSVATSAAPAPMT
jgi:hypothetical protein